MNWHSLDIKEVLKKLDSNIVGLSEREASARLKKYGFNELAKKKRLTALKIFLGQFKSLMVLILLFAVIVSFLVGEYRDAIVIFLIIILNGILGFFQEFKAEKAVESLKKLTTPKAIVVRNGKEKEIPAKELVPGDIILLNEGDKIPADARLISLSSLKVDESILTGESIEVFKKIRILPENVGLADRKNMVYMGTLVTFGHAKAVVTETGMFTNIGKITKMVQETEVQQTPLEREMETLTKWLAVVIVFLSVIIFIIGAIFEGNVFEMFLTAISLAVSAIPEGLPAIITVTLALGVQRMAKKNAIVRRLSAAQTLGSTTVICSDKTGTLTKNEMTVTKVFFNNKLIDVTGNGYVPEGEFLHKKRKVSVKELIPLLRIGSLCNNALLERTDNEWKIIGDHTEGALVVLSAKAGVGKDDFLKNYKFVTELPFSSSRKMMSVIYKHDSGETFCFTKGAPEKVLERCTYYYLNGKIYKLNKKVNQKILDVTDDLADNALRVLLLAYRKLPENIKKADKTIEKDLVFVGLVGMHDPPRKEVARALRICRNAGIRVMMITGDHESTAKAIAKEVGLVVGDVVLMNGQELDDISDDLLYKKVRDISVFARVSPEHKVKILRALKANNEIVAMTGDGVNDAPALKNADIGVAMGWKGTDVARESSDMILLDDNFATLVDAVREGRTIYANIKKFVRYLLSANFDELAVVGLTALMNLPLPFLPIQILWLNLVTDGFPALALGVDPPEKGIMQQPPEDPEQGILRTVLPISIFIGFLAFIATLVMYFWGLKDNIVLARTLAFTVSLIFELFMVFSIRSQSRSAFKEGFFTNKRLVGAVVLSFALQLCVIYLPFFQPIFGTVPLSLLHWLAIFGICGVSFVIMELSKKFFGRKHLH